MSNPTRILIIDDDEDDCVLTTDLLHEAAPHRFTINWALTYAEGKQALDNGNYDVCLVDYRLGERTGLDLIEYAHNRPRPLPCILLTGQGDLGVDLQAMHAGAEDYLVKGKLDANTLERAVRYALERAQTLAELRTAKAAAERANAAKTLFLAHMSHEIRTPLSAIISMAELLMHATPGDEQREYIEMVYDSSRGLLAIVNDILDMAKIEAGKLELEQTPVDLEALLLAVGRMFQPLAAPKGVTLSCTLAPDTPRWILSDPTRLRQVLINLTNNALKFTSAGAVHISAGLEPAQCSTAATGAEGGPPPRWLRFSVEDTGIGIAADKLSHLFNPYAQAESSTARQYGGTGLGLAICKGLVEAFGGALEVQSRPQAGSTFSFTLPCQVVAGAPPALAERSSPETKGAAVEDAAFAQQYPLSILLAEDNQINQKVAVRVLGRLGYQIDVAATGVAVLERLQMQSYDLILMDVHMPEMDGLEATVRIRQGGGAQPCIVAMTAAATGESRQACLEAGMDGYISKPFAMTELRRVLESVCNARQTATVYIDRQQMTTYSELEPARAYSD